MSIEKVYTNSGYVYTIGGIPVGPTYVPPPPPPPTSIEKTLYIASDSNNCIISASAYLNGTGEPIAVWSARNGSASTSVNLPSGNYLVVVSEVNRPVGYSSTMSSTGYTRTSSTFTTSQTISMSGTAVFTGVESAMMSAHYSSAPMVVTASGMFFNIYSGLSPIADEIVFSGPLRLSNSVATSEVAPLAYKYDNTATSWNWSYSSYEYKLNVSAFSAFKFSATAYSRVTAVGSNARAVFTLYQSTPVQTDSSHTISQKYVYNTVNSSVVLQGSGAIRTTTYPQHYYQTPHINAGAYDGASATITPYGWSMSGILK